MARTNERPALFDHAARVISALDSQQRLQIVLKLAERDHVVHELVESLGKSQPLISQHLRVLKRSGLVTSARAGREVVYTLNSPKVAEVIHLAQRVGALTSEDGSGGLGEADASDSAQLGQTAVVDHPDTPNDPDTKMPGLVPDLPPPNSGTA